MPSVLLYDRECRFCRWGVVAIARRCRAGSLALASIQGPVGQEHLAHLDRGRRLATWHLWDGERLRSEADVLDGLAPLVSSSWLRLGLQTARMLPRPLVAAAYRGLADRRDVATKLVPADWKQRAENDLPRFAADPADRRA